MAFTLPKQAQADLSFSLPSHPPQASLTSTFSTRLKASLDQLSQLEGAALCRRRLKLHSTSRSLSRQSRLRVSMAPAERLNSDVFSVRLHLCSARMSGNNLPTVIKFLKVHRGIPDHLLLGIRE
jgi:hypothetical protein